MSSLTTDTSPIAQETNSLKANGNPSERSPDHEPRDLEHDSHPSEEESRYHALFEIHRKQTQVSLENVKTEVHTTMKKRVRNWSIVLGAIMTLVFAFVEYITKLF